MVRQGAREPQASRASVRSDFSARADDLLRGVQRLARFSSKKSRAAGKEGVPRRTGRQPLSAHLAVARLSAKPFFGMNPRHAAALALVGWYLMPPAIPSFDVISPFAAR
jgi:hypothetical protein